MITVTVLLFGPLREKHGRGVDTATVPEGTTVGALYERLFAGTPEAALPVAFAVDEARVPAATALRDGAEVAFLPPVGGG